MTKELKDGLTLALFVSLVGFIVLSAVVDWRITVAILLYDIMCGVQRYMREHESTKKE